MRSRWLAALLNLFFPGTGLFYAGRPVAAVVCLALVLVVANALPAVALHPLPRPCTAVLLWGIPLGLLGVLPAVAWQAAAKAPRDRGPGAWARGWNCVAFAVISMALTNSNWVYVVRPRLQGFRVPSASMEPSVMIGDFIYLALAKSGTPLPARGAIIVFESVEETDLQVLKRLVGLPGDTLEMRGGSLFRNGSPVSEPYVVHTDPGGKLDSAMTAQVRKWQRGRFLHPADSAGAVTLDAWGPFVVPPDSFFVLGDNRDASYDSRYYGFIPFANYFGKPLVVYYSFDGSGSRPLPFLTAIRWKRLGLVLTTQ